jgi:transposase InsO family protein
MQPHSRGPSGFCGKCILTTRGLFLRRGGDYNTERPHSRLGWMTPRTYKAKRAAALRYTVEYTCQMDYGGA